MKHLRLLLDQMLDEQVAQVLRDLGHDAVRVSDIGLACADHEAVLARAVREARVLLTLDEHFGDWTLLPLSQHSGVIRIKANPATSRNVLALLLPFLERSADRSFRDHLVILRPSGARRVHASAPTLSARRHDASSPATGLSDLCNMGVARLPVSGAVLGIDVGFSAQRRSTGFCLLRWDSQSVNWRIGLATADAGERRALLRDLTSGCGALCAVAVDGPLRPQLHWVKSYRAADALLSAGVFQERGKPGQTHAESGPQLHEHATILAQMALEECTVARGEWPLAIAPEAVCEAFQKLFLGVLRDERGYPEPLVARRKWTDLLYPCVLHRLKSLVADVLPGRQVLGNWDLNHHDHIGALVCALTALAYAAGRFVAVGSDADGFIILPPLEYWGLEEEAGGQRWAEQELLVALPKVSNQFPSAQVHWGESAVGHSAADQAVPR